MDQLNVPAFGGVAGRVLKEAFSFSTWLTGFLFASTIFVFAYMLGMMGVEDAAYFLAHCLVPIVICRYALNGYHGEWGGSVFSNRGGSWLEVGLITWRYIALTLVWLIPLTLMGADPGSININGVTILYMTAWVMSPPLLLIVAISSPNFASIFFPQTWHHAFNHRGSDILSLYVVYTGVVTSLSLLFIPVVLGLGSIHRNLGILAVFVAAPFILGIMLSVMGRLCGFFPVSASGALGDPEEASSGGPSPQTLSGKPVLAGARERIAEITSGFQADPQGTLQVLEDLSAAHDSHPLLMHALCTLYAQAGRKEDSLSLAQETLPFLLHHQNMKLSAEIFRLHADSAEELNLSLEEILQLAVYLQGEGEEPGALKAYRLILEDQPTHAKAIKGVMKIAEDMGHRGHRTEAAEIYRYLLDQCSESPLAEYMWQGLSQVEPKQA